MDPAVNSLLLSNAVDTSASRNARPAVDTVLLRLPSPAIPFRATASGTPASRPVGGGDGHKCQPNGEKTQAGVFGHRAQRHREDDRVVVDSRDRRKEPGAPSGNLVTERDRRPAHGEVRTRIGIDDQGIALRVRAQEREIGEVKHDILGQPRVWARVAGMHGFNVEVAILGEESEICRTLRIRRLQIDRVCDPADWSGHDSWIHSLPTSFALASSARKTSSKLPMKPTLSKGNPPAE